MLDAFFHITDNETKNGMLIVKYRIFLNILQVTTLQHIISHRFTKDLNQISGRPDFYHPVLADRDHQSVVFVQIHATNGVFQVEELGVGDFPARKEGHINDPPRPDLQSRQ